VVQRAIGEPPVVAPARPFAASLATRQAPDLALEPLGHELSPLGSPGLVVGTAAPVSAALSGRVDLPLQRSASEDRGAPAAPGWSSFDSAGPTPLVAGTPAVDSATLLGLIQRLPAGSATLTTSVATHIPASPPGTLDLRPAVAWVAASSASPSATPNGASLPAPTISASAPAIPEPTVRPSSVGQARRLGLGAPLRPVREPAVQRAPAEAGPVASPGTGLPNVPTGQATGPIGSEPVLPTTSLLSEPGPSRASTSGAAPADPGAALESIGPSELPVVRPISIQRLYASEPIASASVRPGHPPGPGAAALSLVPGFAGQVAQVQRQGAESAPGGPMDAPASPDGIRLNGPAIAGMGAPAGSMSPLGGRVIRVSTAGSLVQPAAQPGADPRAGAPTPGQTHQGVPLVARSIADSGRAFEAPRTAGSMLPASFDGKRQKEPAGPLVQRSAVQVGSAPADAGPQPVPLLAGTPTPVQRAVEIRELEIDATVSDGSLGASPPNGAAPGSPPASAGRGGGAAPATPGERDRELDELAHRLYGRIRSRLAAELLADRERAGMITDLR
jgi:hypothetical protein